MNKEIILIISNNNNDNNNDCDNERWCFEIPQEFNHWGEIATAKRLTF